MRLRNGTSDVSLRGKNDTNELHTIFELVAVGRRGLVLEHHQAVSPGTGGRNLPGAEVVAHRGKIVVRQRRRRRCGAARALSPAAGRARPVVMVMAVIRRRRIGSRGTVALGAIAI